MTTPQPPDAAPDTPAPPGLLTTEQVAERLRVSEETVRRYARDNTLASVKLPGGHRRFRPEDVDALLSGLR
jgi:excisionase family DNA binding protein